jgi:TRAP-type C4-dicarboxylate transport system substrate-binding protein
MVRLTKTIVYTTLTFLGWLLPSQAVAETKIRLATLLPRGSSHYQVLESMGQQWRAVSGGAVSLTIYADGTMGGEVETVQRMRIGQLQAATLSAAGLSEIDPSVGALEKIPMVYRSLDEVEYVRSRMQAKIEQRLEAKGFVVLFWADTGWINIFCRQAALHPDDFKRTKVFVGAMDHAEFDLVKALGFAPVPLEWTDVLTSLQTGMVDTVPTAPFFALAGQYDLVARHMLELPWAPLVGGTVITTKAWNAIPPNDRESFRKAAVEAGQQMQAQGRRESLAAIEAMKKRGLQVEPVSPALLQEWQRFTENTYPRLRGSMVPADMFDEVLRLVKEYRASGPGAKS